MLTRWRTLHTLSGDGSPPTRRAVLAAGLGLLGVVVSPVDALAGVMRPDLAQMCSEAERLLAGAIGNPRLVVSRARGCLTRIEGQLGDAWGLDAVHLHRAGAQASLALASSQRWTAGSDVLMVLAMAKTHAGVLRDGGPLRAHALRIESNIVGRQAHAVDAHSPEAARLLIAARHAAGGGHNGIVERASSSLSLAWELAAQKREREAMVELTCARAEIDLARTWGLSYDDDLLASRESAVYRRLGKYQTAQRLLVDAPAWTPVRAGSGLVDLARCHAARGDVDGAALTLEEAWLLNCTHGLAGRQHLVTAARAMLPDSVAVRQLDDVIQAAARA